MTTCRNCGQPIDRNTTTYWVHTATNLVRCANGNTQARP